MSNIQCLCGLIIEGKDLTVPLKESKVNATVQGFIANVESQLTYINETTEALQTRFIFPLDDMSAVYKFEAYVNKKHIIAECKDKEEAKKTYKEAISSGHTALFISEADTAGDTFECKLGNLPAGESAVLTLSYVVELSVQPDGKLRFILPTVLNPRYSPEVGHAIESGSEPTPSQVDIKTPCELTFSASISGCYNVESITSPIDKLNVKIGDDKLSASVDLSELFQFDHDLTMDIKYGNINKPQVILEPGNLEKDGFLKEDILMVNFFPDIKQGTHTENSQREFIFVIDRSGSMQGNRIEKAKETLLLLLKSLPVGCMFNVVSFGSDHTFLFKKSEIYSEKTLQKALSVQSKMDADMGGTEILEPLKKIYSETCKHGYPRQIFLLTDGEVGNTSEVISLVRRHKKNTRVFTFGIGDGVSTSLIKNVAKASRGKAVFIKDNDNMKAKVISAMKSSLTDCLHDVNLNWELPECFTATTIPVEPPVIFSGDNVVLFAVLKSSDSEVDVSGSLTLTGTLGGNSVSYKMKIESTRSPHIDLPLHRVAAKYQIKELEIEESNSYDGQSGKEKEKIILFSQAANIISKYTAFVGVDQDTKVPVSLIKEVNYHQSAYMAMGRPMMQCCMADIDVCLDRGAMLDVLKCKSAELESGASTFMARATMYKSRPWWKRFVPSLSSFSWPSFLKKKATEEQASVHIEDEQEGQETEDEDDSCTDFSSSNQLTGDKLMDLVSQQNFDRSWAPTQRLATIINTTETNLKAKYKGSVWCTAIVIIYLETNYSHCKAEWGMICDKATQWLTSQDKDGKTVEDILQEVKESDIVKIM
ncbi:von Willebrand factor A domain-containing protein 5A-like [Mytilus galloprovincialis]|uniref:von Willebrand factor A domain-containing protein 5A-like n=1 Tax=Mytilus galloprovincialis TaxID=29158 RepID=UPI003F7C3819